MFAGGAARVFQELPHLWNVVEASHRDGNKVALYGPIACTYFY